MKNIIILFFASLLLGVPSCKNKDIVFPNFDYSTVYFPYQTPVRTLVLGDYEYNTGKADDNNLNFIISAHMGGVYQNNTDRIIKFVVDTSLAQRLLTSTRDSLIELPSKYYTISPTDQFVIPKGSLYAGFSVQLKEAFLDDTMAYKTRYIIPIRMVSSSSDSVLSGKTTVYNPDRRIAADWTVVPLDYTLFGIKYVNAYHGNYLRRGVEVVKDLNQVSIGNLTYRQPNVENDEVINLKTTGRRKVTITAPVKVVSGISPGSFKMDLTFDNSGNCTITNTPASAFVISGSGKFSKSSEEWGGKKRNAIYLNYTINVSGTTHAVNDTLVIRDRAVVFESFVPVVIK